MGQITTSIWGILPMLPEKLANVLVDPVAQTIVEHGLLNICILWTGARSTPVGTKAGTCYGLPIYRLDAPTKGCSLIIEVRNEQHFVVRRKGFNGQMWEELEVGAQV